MHVLAFRWSWCLIVLPRTPGKLATLGGVPMNPKSQREKKETRSAGAAQHGEAKARGTCATTPSLNVSLIIQWQASMRWRPNSRFCRVIDPIDGTTNYAHSYPSFAGTCA